MNELPIFFLLITAAVFWANEAAKSKTVGWRWISGLCAIAAICWAIIQYALT